MDNHYVYLFIREDLSIPQQIIQTAHAVDDMNKSYPHESENYMVLCSVKDEERLFLISELLKDRNIHHETFFEPDINGHTAIATRPLKGEERKILRNFNTMK